jgi:hypothetical protein
MLGGVREKETAMRNSMIVAVAGVLTFAIAASSTAKGHTPELEPILVLAIDPIRASTMVQSI